MQWRLGDTGLYTFNGLGCVKTTSWRRRRRRRNSRRRRRSVWGESPPLCKHGAMWSSGPVEISSASIFFFFSTPRGRVVLRSGVNRGWRRGQKKKKKVPPWQMTASDPVHGPRRCSVLGRCNLWRDTCILVSCIWSCARYGIREKAGVHMAPRAPCECAPGWAPFTMQRGLRHGGTRRRGTVLGRGGSGPSTCIFPFSLSFFPKRLKQQSTLHLVPLHLHPSHSLSFPFLSCPLPLFFFLLARAHIGRERGGERRRRRRKKN